MDTYSNGQTRYKNLLNQINNPLGENAEAFNIGQALGNIGLGASTGFGKADKNFGGIDVSKGVGDTDIARFGDLTNGGTDFSKLNITDPKKIEELTKLYTQANL